MDRSVEKTGKTVEAALSLALKELKAEKSEVKVEVLEEANKGLLGIIGGKDAKIRVTYEGDRNEKIREFLGSIFAKMGLTVNVDIKREDEYLKVTLSGEKTGLLIGRRGETLDALQCLTSVVANKGQTERVRVILDMENYREKRKESLEKLAKRVAETVTKYKKDIALEPMTAYERRIIHSALQETGEVTTYSVGEEPYRKVVITLK